MTEKDLLTDLKGKPFVTALVGKARDIQSLEGVTECEQDIFEISGASAHLRAIGYYVQNRGQEGEAAFWRDNEPRPFYPKTTTAKVAKAAEALPPDSDK